MSAHPLEKRWGVSAWDILSAIERGFRAQVDVKGKLAELFLYRRLEQSRVQGVIDSLEWYDKDGMPDFLVEYRGRPLRLECKNVRTPTGVRIDAKVELQKTRNSKDGRQTRGYQVGEFEVLAVCLFNRTGKWDYLYIATRQLARRPEPLQEFLKIMQPVPLHADGAWRDDLLSALSDATP